MTHQDTDEVFDEGILAPQFHNEELAVAYLESLRWPDGPVCPHCGESERKPYRLKRRDAQGFGSAPPAASSSP